MRCHIEAATEPDFPMSSKIQANIEMASGLRSVLADMINVADLVPIIMFI